MKKLLILLALLSLQPAAASTVSVGGTIPTAPHYNPFAPHHHQDCGTPIYLLQNNGGQIINKVSPFPVGFNHPIQSACPTVPTCLPPNTMPVITIIPGHTDINVLIPRPPISVINNPTSILYPLPINQNPGTIDIHVAPVTTIKPVADTYVDPCANEFVIDVDDDFKGDE